MRHLRSVWDADDKETLERILRRAQALKHDRRERRLAPTLSGRVLAMLFEKESTRTRMSFESGVAQLGGSCVVMQARDTQLVSGELLRDAARVIGGYCDAMMVRTFGHDAIEEYARHAGVPVINGMSDLDHPCQVLTDLFTVFERREDPFGLTWAWVGESRGVANGLLAAASLCGFELRIASPEARAPDAGYRARAGEKNANVIYTEDPKEAVAGAHVVMTGSWTGGEEARDLLAPYQLAGGLLAEADDDHLVLHALPAQRGQEITDDVLEGRHSVVFQQASNRLPVQQALLEWLLEVPVL